MTRRALALLLLREAGPRGVTTGEFLEAGVGSRYGARLLELRKEGHQIEAQRLREGSWRYILVDADASGGTGPQTAPSGLRGPELGATSDSGSVEPAGVSAVQLFPDDDAWLALRAKDAA